MQIVLNCQSLSFFLLYPITTCDEFVNNFELNLLNLFCSVQAGLCDWNVDLIEINCSKQKNGKFVCKIREANKKFKYTFVYSVVVFYRNNNSLNCIILFLNLKLQSLESQCVTLKTCFLNHWRFLYFRIEYAIKTPLNWKITNYFVNLSLKLINMFVFPTTPYKLFVCFSTCKPSL